MLEGQNMVLACALPMILPVKFLYTPHSHMRGRDIILKQASKHREVNHTSTIFLCYLGFDLSLILTTGNLYKTNEERKGEVQKGR